LVAVGCTTQPHFSVFVLASVCVILHLYDTKLKNQAIKYNGQSRKDVPFVTFAS